MILFDSMEAMREYTFHALIYVANQLVIEEERMNPMDPSDLSWVYTYKTPETKAHGCNIGVKDNDRPTLQGDIYYSVIEFLGDQPYVRFICEKIVSKKGPTAIDFKCVYDPGKAYTYEVSFPVAPDEDETQYHHAVAHIFDRCLSMLKTINHDSYVMHLDRKLDEEEGEDDHDGKN